MQIVGLLQGYLAPLLYEWPPHAPQSA